VAACESPFPATVLLVWVRETARGEDLEHELRLMLHVNGIGHQRRRLLGGERGGGDQDVCQFA